MTAQQISQLAGNPPPLSPSPAGVYTSLNATVDAEGRVVSAANGSGGSGVIPPNYLTGLNMSAAGGSTGFTILAGWATDSTQAVLMKLPTSFSKSTSAWASGSSFGALDTGTIAASTWYHVWLISNGTTADVLISLSASAPTMPSGYTYARRIGAIKTNSSANILAFNQQGDEFLWYTPVINDYSGKPSDTGGSPTTVTLSVPSGVKVWAMLRCYYIGAAGGSMVLVYDTDAAGNLAPASTGGNVTANIPSSSADASAAHLRVRTNTSAQVYAISSAGTTTPTLYIATYGWIDRRGQDG